MRKLRFADLFCGAGGTSIGAEMSGAAQCVFALNHWNVAVETHSTNFPNAKHVNSRLDMTSPAECESIDLLFASPECTHHSRARGGRPTSDQQRSGAWDVLKWVEHHRPSYIAIENVVEFKEWGPVGENARPLVSKRGKFFDAWVMAIQGAGYKVEFRELNAADYGAATSRNRLFVLARKGNRSPIWPEPTHSKQAGGELPGLGMSPWRSAAEVIDWTIPIGSIFSRKRPLADKTLLRLEAGIRRFVGPFVAQFNEGVERRTFPLNDALPTITAGGKRFGLAVPYVVKFRNNETSESVGEPVSTITAGGGHHGLAIPFVSKQFGTKNGAYNPNVSINDPLGTITTIDHTGFAIPYMLDVNHGGDSSRTGSLDEPFGAVTSKRGKALAVPWLSSFYGNETSVSASQPVPTVTTKDRHSLCIAVCQGPHEWPEPHSDAMRQLQATMRKLHVADLLFRMFQNYELSAAQGFPSDYFFAGTKADVTRQIGNSVSPSVAQAISAAIAS